jgi:hypothetical protein
MKRVAKSKKALHVLGWNSGREEGNPAKIKIATDFEFWINVLWFGMCSVNPDLLLVDPPWIICVFLRAFVKLRRATITFVMSAILSISASVCVCLSVRMEQPYSHRMDFREIWYLIGFRRSVEKIQVSLTSNKINGLVFGFIVRANTTLRTLCKRLSSTTDLDRFGYHSANS